jgi:hypothetical protein
MRGSCATLREFALRGPTGRTDRDCRLPGSSRKVRGQPRPTSTRVQHFHCFCRGSAAKFRLKRRLPRLPPDFRGVHDRPSSCCSPVPARGASSDGARHVNPAILRSFQASLRTRPKRSVRLEGRVTARQLPFAAPAGIGSVGWKLTFDVTRADGVVAPKGADRGSDQTAGFQPHCCRLHVRARAIGSPIAPVSPRSTLRAADRDPSPSSSLGAIQPCSSPQKRACKRSLRNRPAPRSCVLRGSEKR